MSKKKITLQTAILDLRTLFEIENNKFNSMEQKGTFLIHKQHFERGEIIEMLQTYFSDKYVIDDPEIEIGGITLVFTKFELRPKK